jgi:hypothetical protein
VLPDFMPTTYCGDAACSSGALKHPLNFFRSHYGGDVTGAITSITTEDDFGNILSSSLTSRIQ